jgi:hypothetical protein
MIHITQPTEISKTCHALELAKTGASNRAPYPNDAKKSVEATTAPRGFVAQIGLRVSFPFPQTDLAYCLCDRYAKSGVAVEDGDADLDFRDLPFEVPRHERLTQ